MGLLTTRTHRMYRNKRHAAGWDTHHTGAGMQTAIARSLGQLYPGWMLRLTPGLDEKQRAYLNKKRMKGNKS